MKGEWAEIFSGNQIDVIIFAEEKKKKNTSTEMMIHNQSLEQGQNFQC